MTAGWLRQARQFTGVQTRRALRVWRDVHCRRSWPFEQALLEWLAVHAIAHPIPVLNYTEFVTADGEELTTDLLKVAAVHGKRHDDLLRLIRLRVAEAGDRGLRNFTESSYMNQQGKSQPIFVMTKDGYRFLVGRMTGKKAVQHQWAFIAAFNAMAAHETTRSRKFPSPRKSRDGCRRQQHRRGLG